MEVGSSSYRQIQNISSSQSPCSFVTRISLHSTHFRGALIGLSFLITIEGLVSPYQQLQFSLSTTTAKEKLNQEELNQKRRMEEVWNEIKGFSQSQKIGRSSLFQAHHLSLSLSLSQPMQHKLMDSFKLICGTKGRLITYTQGAKG